MSLPFNLAFSGLSSGLQTKNAVVSNFNKANGIGYWKFDETSGNLLNKATTSAGWTNGAGSAGDGTVTGCTYSQSGVVGNSFGFDGVDDEIEAPDDVIWDITGNISICGWIKPTNFSNYRTMIAKRVDASNVTFQLGADITTGRIIWYAGVEVHHSNTAMTTGVWNFIAMTLTSGNSGTFYLNGSSDGTFTNIGGRTTNTASLQIGHSQPTPIEVMIGNIDELSLWSRILTSAEITTLYNGGSGYAIIWLLLFLLFWGWDNMGSTGTLRNEILVPKVYCG